jgi:hypothetical protein
MKTALAKIFEEAGELDVKKDSLGAQCITYMIKNKAFTSEVAEPLFAKAYSENSWSMEKGRPKAGSPLTAAPPTVKNYLSALRNMYKFGLDIRDYKTMGEIRNAVNQVKAANRAKADVVPSLVGVQISKEDILTGFLVHDISAVIKHLPDNQRDEFEAKLQRLLSQYAKKAPPELKLAA